MSNKNYFTYIDNSYICDNYFNDVFEIFDDTMIFEENKLYYSEYEDVNKYINHPYRKYFLLNDFVYGIKKGIIRDKKYVNLILNINKNYAFVENNEVYQLSIYKYNNDYYMAYFKIPEKNISQYLNRNELIKILKNKLRIINDTFDSIKIPTEAEIENKLKLKEKSILSFTQSLFDQINNNMPVIDYSVIDNMVNNSKYLKSYQFVDNILCMDVNNNFYKISITYIEKDKYKVDYKYMKLRRQSINKIFDYEFNVDRKTEKKLLSK